MRRAVLPMLLGVVLAAGLRAEDDPALARLQQKIDAASVEGSYSHVQGLRVELAERLKAGRRYAEAARQYELLLASRPSRRDRIRFYIQLGDLRSALRDFSGAIESYQNALHDAPRSFDANLALARAYAQVDLDSIALQFYQKCLRLRPAEHQVYEELAALYQKLGYLDRAIAYYQKDLQYEQRPETYLGIADCYVRMDNIAKATEVLQTAKAVLPRADYDVRLGEIYRRRGDLARACAAWEEALKLDPQRDDVRLQMALAYSRLGRPAEADRLLQHLLSVYPMSPLVHFSRAWVLYDRGQPRAARAEALAVERLNPTDLVRAYTEKLLARLPKTKE